MRQFYVSGPLNANTLANGISLIWDGAREILRETLSADVFSRQIDPLRPLELSAVGLVLEVPATISVETLAKSFQGRLLFVGTGQSTITDTKLLQKIQARFKVGKPNPQGVPGQAAVRGKPVAGTAKAKKRK